MAPSRAKSVETKSGEQVPQSSAIDLTTLAITRSRALTSISELFDAMGETEARVYGHLAEAGEQILLLREQGHAEDVDPLMELFSPEIEGAMLSAAKIQRGAIARSEARGTSTVHDLSVLGESLRLATEFAGNPIQVQLPPECTLYTRYLEIYGDLQHAGGMRPKHFGEIVLTSVADLHFVENIVQLAELGIAPPASWATHGELGREQASECVRRLEGGEAPKELRREFEKRRDVSTLGMSEVIQNISHRLGKGEEARQRISQSLRSIALTMDESERACVQTFFEHLETLSTVTGSSLHLPGLVNVIASATGAVRDAKQAAKKSLTPDQSLSGFINELRVAKAFQAMGITLYDLDTREYEGAPIVFGSHHHNRAVPKEIDLIAKRPGGKLYFVEVKSSVTALTKELTNAGDSQVAALQEASHTFNATPVIVITTDSVSDRQLHDVRNVLSRCSPNKPMPTVYLLGHDERINALVL